MKKWQLKSVRQCSSCPWVKGNNPFNIPNGYSLEKHKKLRETIADGVPIEKQLEDLQNDKPLRIMSCHKYEEAHCIGWLHNQIGSKASNIRLRIQLRTCENAHLIELIGEQHPTFEDTIPDNENG